jgi:hypothetical protein
MLAPPSDDAGEGGDGLNLHWPTRWVVLAGHASEPCAVWLRNLLRFQRTTWA